MKDQEIRQASLRQHQQALYELLGEFDRVCKQLQIPYVLFAGTLLGAVRHQGIIPWDDDLDVMMLRSDYARFLKAAGDVLNQEKYFLQKEFSPHWPMFFSKLRLNGTACLEKYHPKDEDTHQGVYMDIFPCDDARPTKLGRLLQFAASKVVIAKALDQRGYDTDSKAKRVFMGACRLLPMKPFVWLTQRGKPGGKLVHGFLGGAHGFSRSVYERSWFEDRCSGAFEKGQYPIPRQYDAVLRGLYGDYLRLPPPEERKVKQHALLVDLDHSWEDYRGYRDNMKFDVYTRSIR